MAPTAWSRASTSTKTAITVIRPTTATTARTTRPRTSTRSGRVAPTYIAGPTSANTAQASAGSAVPVKPSAANARKPKVSAVTVTAKAIHTRARRWRSVATSIRHQVCASRTHPCTRPSSAATSVVRYATMIAPHPRIVASEVKSAGCRHPAAGKVISASGASTAAATATVISPS